MYTLAPSIGWFFSPPVTTMRNRSAADGFGGFSSRVCGCCDWNEVFPAAATAQIKEAANMLAAINLAIFLGFIPMGTNSTSTPACRARASACVTSTIIPMRREAKLCPRGIRMMETDSCAVN
jgi:hypothetical protein